MGTRYKIDNSKINFALTVDGMTCEHCKKAVESKIITMYGVDSAVVDLTAKTLTVEFDPNCVTLKDIVTAVTEEGYTAEL
ncbi:heavy-metal-associated domain-containing protein [Sporomusa sp.]|uniref:heavy-metal-associated domain-containing protein n=1 Tax=Sporomusa sp. TaxID=2078658 RepID=UPI002CCD8C18|nr:cation transporter [Sporomusa sp.]HWR44230.1 cation transporter [Sporomusa sp.]